MERPSTSSDTGAGAIDTTPPSSPEILPATPVDSPALQSTPTGSAFKKSRTKRASRERRGSDSAAARAEANKKKLIEEDSGPLGVLIFTLRNAKNLKAADSNGKSDPFVVVRLPGMPTLQPFKSKTKRRTLNPEWNQQHEFPGYLADIVRKPLELRVYDWDALSFNDPLGSLSVPLWDLFRQRLANSKLTTGEEGTRQVAQLHFTDVPLQGVDTGTISFSVTFELKFVLGMLPGTPVHASAAQALRRPPPSDATCLEKGRDKLLLFLGNRFFLGFAIIWAIALCGFGAFAALTFAALFVPKIIVAILPEDPGTADWYECGSGVLTQDECGSGAFAIGMSDGNLEMWANICVQVLTGLFSYFNIITLPWRLSILYHTCGNRSDAPGRDFYGRPTEAIWFHISPRVRGWITFLLLSSTTSHFATQSSRFVYPSFKESNDFPGSLICNVTFGLAVLFGMIAGCVQDRAERQIVKANPGRYPPSIIAHIQDLRKRGEFSWIALLCCKLGSSHEERLALWHMEKELKRMMSRRNSDPNVGSIAPSAAKIAPSLNPFTPRRNQVAPEPLILPEAEHAPEPLALHEQMMVDPPPPPQPPVLFEADDRYTMQQATSYPLPPVRPPMSYNQMQHERIGRLLAQRQLMKQMPSAADHWNASTDGGLSSSRPSSLGFEKAMVGRGHPPLVGRAMQLLPLEPQQAQKAMLALTVSSPSPKQPAPKRELKKQKSAPVDKRAILQRQLTASFEEAALREKAQQYGVRPNDLYILEFDTGASLGLSLTSDRSGRTVVTSVVPGEAADRKGCQVGSVLVEVDGTSVAGMMQPQVLRLLTRQGGGATRAFTFLRVYS